MVTKKPTKPKKSKKSEPLKVSSKFKREVDFKINERATTIKQQRIVAALTERIAQAELAKPYQLRMKALTEEVEKLRAECEAGVEKREVYCMKEYDFAHQEVRIRRMDTREVVETTTMTEEDRQEMLPLGPQARPVPAVVEEPGKPPGQAIREAREARGEVATESSGEAEEQTEGDGDDSAPSN